MSRASRRRGAVQVQRDPVRYGEAFRRQYRSLVALAGAFDEGDEDAAYLLSVVLRALLHDQLLDRVLKLKRLHLRDTASRPPSLRGIGFGLTKMRMTAGVPNVGQVVPAFDDPATRGNPDVIFRDWWDRDLAIFTNERAWTRSYVVLEMANTDAAHVDAAQDYDYLHLLSDDASFSLDGKPLRGNVATASVRQIAWELQWTLEDQRPDLLASPSFDRQEGP